MGNYYCRKKKVSTNTETEIYRTIHLPVVAYRRETLSLTVTKEHRLRVFDNRVLRKIPGTMEGVKTEMEKTAQREASRCVLLTKYY